MPTCETRLQKRRIRIFNRYARNRAVCPVFYTAVFEHEYRGTGFALFCVNFRQLQTEGASIMPTGTFRSLHERDANAPLWTMSWSQPQTRHNDYTLPITDQSSARRTANLFFEYSFEYLNDNSDVGCCRIRMFIAYLRDERKTDFIGIVSRNFAVTRSLKIPPHLKRVATLPCEILVGLLKICTKHSHNNGRPSTEKKCLVCRGADFQ